MTSFKAADVAFTPLGPGQKATPGQKNTSYMLSIEWSKQNGWGQPKIGPRQAIPLDPLAGVLQAAVTCFEGMKAYKDDQGNLRLFRPAKNFDRLKRSGARLGLPTDWDNDELVDLLCKLLYLDADLVSPADGSNIYIRPTLIETSESFGIKPVPFAQAAMLYIVCSVDFGKAMYPSAEGKGISLNACKEYIRAWPGGNGSYKLGANYGPVAIAKKEGYAMPLWLHGEEDFISEAGGMNVWIIKEAKDGSLEFATMGLDNGIVLPGITRQSLMELLEDHASGKAEFPLEGMPKNIRVVQRDIPMSEIIESSQDGTLKGMFGCGTGVVLVQIGEIEYKDKLYPIAANPLIRLIRDTITGLQRGRVERDDWSHVVPEWNP